MAIAMAYPRPPFPLAAPVPDNAKVSVVLERLHWLEKILKRWEERVACHGSLHVGEIKIRAQRQRLAVNVGAATDEGLTIASQRGKLIKARNGLHAGMGEA